MSLDGSRASTAQVPGATGQLGRLVVEQLLSQERAQKEAIVLKVYPPTHIAFVEGSWKIISSWKDPLSGAMLVLVGGRVGSHLIIGCVHNTMTHDNAFVCGC